MRIDELQPRWHHREVHHVPLPTPTGHALAAVRELTWAEVPLFRVLMRVRMLGRPLPPPGPILAAMVELGFTELAADDGQLVYGAVGRPWSLSGGLVRLPADADAAAARFRAFDEPGWARMVLDFRADGRTLTTETRVWLTDAGSRRRFAAYWLVVRPFSGAIRRGWLRAARRRALA